MYQSGNLFLIRNLLFSSQNSRACPPFKKFSFACELPCPKVFFSVWISLSKTIFLCACLFPKKSAPPHSFSHFFFIFIWQPIISMEFFVSFLEMRVNIGSLYMCGLLGDFSKDAVVSYLVSDKACWLFFLKTKRISVTAHYMRVVHKMATSFL